MKNIAAALVFFTRLPFWRLKFFNLPAENFKQVINYWSVVGLLTGGIMAGSLWGGAQILPYSVAVILAIVVRLFITGALHEDGLADFMDGFGGGTKKDRILEIMKDSHIGTYGVIALILYFMSLYQVFISLDLRLACLAILVGDPLCKYISSYIVVFLPYARTAETSKSKVVYTKITLNSFIIASIAGLLPLILFVNVNYWVAVVLPLLIFCILVILMKKKIQGYTGDCCGAMFLLCELAFYLGVTGILSFK